MKQEQRGCYCPTCGTQIAIPHDLEGGAMSLCEVCENVVKFPGGPALWFEKQSELTMKSHDLQQIRQMRAHLRARKQARD